MAFGASAGATDNNALTKGKSITARAVQLAKKNNGVIGALLGKVHDKVADGYVQAQNLTWNEGQKFDIHVLPSDETVGTIANQAAAIAARSRDALNNIALSNSFNMTHFSKKWDLDNYDLDLIKGGEPTAPAGDYRTNVDEMVSVWMLNSLQTQFCTSQTQARSTLGGLPYIVDDTNAYIADRSDAAHTNLRSYVNAAGAGINATTNVLTAITTLQGRGGYPTLGVLPTSLYAKLHGQIIAYGRYEMPGKDVAGSNSFMFSEVRFILEPGLDASLSSHMYLLNEEDWRFYFYDRGMKAKFMDDPAGEDSTVLHMRFLAGVGCINPKRQGKVTGLS